MKQKWPQHSSMTGPGTMTTRRGAGGNYMNLFQAARHLLAGADEAVICNEIVGQPDDLVNAARELLAGLGYVSCQAYGTPNVISQNRIALLDLAARFERAFQLPMRHSPGAVFFGGTVSPAAFGIAGHGEAAIGVGGRGETFREAFESCVGEAAERLAFFEWDDDPIVMPLDGDCGLTGDELSWALGGIGLDTKSDLARLDWVEAQSLTDDRRVMFPSELMLRRPEIRRACARRAESGGVGAGVTLDDATMSGLLECIERDAMALWWFGGRSAFQPDPAVAQHPDLINFVQQCRAGSSRPVWLLDISSEISIPVFAALSSEPNGKGVITGFAADPDPHIAVRKAFLEMCQMELAQELSVGKLQEHSEVDLQSQDRLWIDRYNRLNTTEFPRLIERIEVRYHKVAAPGHRIQTTLDALSACGFTAYVLNIYRPQLMIPVARAIVPGLQSAEPDWVSPRLADAMGQSGISRRNLRENITLI